MGVIIIEPKMAKSLSEHFCRKQQLSGEIMEVMLMNIKNRTI